MKSTPAPWIQQAPMSAIRHKIRKPDTGTLFLWFAIFLFLSYRNTPAQISSGTPATAESTLSELAEPEQTAPDATASPHPALIRVNSNLISVPVSVTNTTGQAVAGLRLSDFRLIEDKQVATITQLTDSSRSNLNMALLFDLSGSLSPNFRFEQQAALDFLKKIWKTGDTITIIPFDVRPDVRLRSSDNLQEAIWAINQLYPTKLPTAFFDTIIMAARILEESATAASRQAIIVISDGYDNSSDSDLDAVVTEIRRQNTVFYAINPSGASVRLNRLNIKGQEYLTALAQATGGEVFITDKAEELETIFTRIATDLRAQYLLNYYSLIQTNDGNFHRIEVTLPAQPDLRIRARPGFLSLPRQQTGE